MYNSILVKGYEFPFYWAEKLNQDTVSFLEEIKTQWTPTPGIDDLWHQTVYDRLEGYMENIDDTCDSIGQIIDKENTFYEINMIQVINYGEDPEDVFGDLSQDHVQEYLKIIEK